MFAYREEPSDKLAQPTPFTGLIDSDPTVAAFYSDMFGEPVDTLTGSHKSENRHAQADPDVVANRDLLDSVFGCQIDPEYR